MHYIFNFAAFCLPIFLFSFWGVLGYSMLSILRSQRYTIQNLLLAPAVGFCITLFPIFWLNRIGIPISHFAIILSLILLTVSLALLAWKRPIFPVNYYLPFVGLFFLTLCLIGSPLLTYGFDWVSYGNDDMTNYSLGAVRFLQHGYFDVPNVDDLTQRRDYSLLYWFSHVPGVLRAGSEIIIAWVSGVTHLNPLQIFMPVTIAFHLMLISVAGALVYNSRRNYYIALTTCLLLAFSAQTMLGTFYQLNAQVIGLSILITCAILICQNFFIHQRFYAFRQGILIALVFSTLLFVYPEVVAFLITACGMYFGIQFLKGWRINKAFCLTVLCVVSFCIIFLNTYLIAILDLAFLQYRSVTQVVDFQVVLFPYFLLPSGLANLWGLLPMTDIKDEPFMSLLVISGAILSLLVTFLAVRLTFMRTTIAGIIAFVMICVGMDFFIKNYGFGLFKLAMFAQPFFIAVIAISIFEFLKNKRWKQVVIVALILSNVGSFLFYLDRSKAKSPGSFSEIAYGSTTKINHEYAKLIADVPKDAILLSDDFNISLLKSQALLSTQYRFIPLTSPGSFIFKTLPDNYLLFPSLSAKLFFIDRGREIANQYTNLAFFTAQFNLQDAHSNKTDFIDHTACIHQEECNKHGFVIADTSLRSIFNRRSTGMTSTKYNFMLIKFPDIHNHLVFIDSSLGRIYHSVIERTISNLSLFNLESDVIYSNRSMQAIGRYLLMRVFNPSEKIRMEITLTNTFDGNGINKLPPASVVGNKRVNFPIMGRGSARVFSEPFSPQIIHGVPYVATDMNAEGTSFPSHRKGIMNLYNKNLAIDLRQVVTFVRDISLISEDDYRKLNPPNSVKNFPNDLANPDLEYSGIYEDGWISENSFVRLKQQSTNNQLIIQGMLPKIDPKFTDTTMVVLLDGKKLTEQKLQLGEFKINIPVATKTINRKIELHFNKAQRLPGGDDRLVGAQIKFIGFG